jgi:hypothetical protein
MSEKMSDSLKRVCPLDWLAEETGALWIKLEEILDEAADFAPFELIGDLREGARDCCHMAYLSISCANDGQLFNFHNSCERVVDRHFELQEAVKPYLIYDFPDWRGQPVGARNGCDWAAPMILHWRIIHDISMFTEEIHNRLFALLSLAPEEQIKELEWTREELEAARASNPFGLPESIEDYDVRMIFGAAQKNGYGGKSRNLKQHLATWKGDERASGERWLLSRAELEQFLRYLSERQRKKP